MKSGLYSRLRSLGKAAVSSLAIIAVALSAAPDAWGQQQPDEKGKRGETKRPSAQIDSGLPEGLNVTFEIGGHVRLIRGDRPGKFQETRHFPKGPFIRNIYLNFNPSDSPFILNFKGLELGERDRRISAQAERVGTYRTQFLWDEISRFYSDGRSFHVSTSPGFLAVDPALRARLEAAPNASVAGTLVGAALPALVRQEVQTQAVVGLRVRWDQLLVTQSYHPNESWEFFFHAQNLRRNGRRPRPTGTFANENAGPAGDLVWEALGVELPEPVKYRTTNLTLGLQYSRPRWRVGAEYNLSLFRNSIQTLTWENPFRVTDALANRPGFNVGRNRFVQAQLALPPDNQYQSVGVHAGVDLPRETQLRGALTWGRGTQDVPFLPYTLNSAMTAANLLPGQPPLFELAPPQPSLGGVVHTLDQDYTLASRAWKNMRFLIQYRYNDKDNRTPIIIFPGLPTFGDSGVRTAVDFYDLPIENFPTSYTRQNTTARWEWGLRKNLDWELEYDLEVWNRTFRETDRTNEHSVRGRLDYRPWMGVALKTDYLYSIRKPRFYLTQPLAFNPNLNVGTAAMPISGGPGWEATPTTRFINGLREEFNQLRRFDVAKRIRNDVGVALEVTRWENATFSASYRYLRDDYDKSFYGLLYDAQSAVDAEVSYFPARAQEDDATTVPEDGWKEHSFFYAHYSREQNQIGYRGLGHRIAGAARNVTACCATFPIANTFDRSSRINFDMFEFGFNTASRGERTALNLSYGLGFARDRTHTANPFPILAVSPRTAGAYNYPDVISWQQEVTVSLTQQLRPGLNLGASYRFEPYRLDDYYTNNLQPYSALQPAATAATALTPRYLFLDARFTSYHAHVVTVFLRYSF